MTVADAEKEAPISRFAYRAAPLRAVRLLQGPVLDRQKLNTRYLLELAPDRLLHNYRVQAGLPSTAAPFEGWEAPACGLRGHFVGHYLSACAQGYAATGDALLLDRLNVVVQGLAECQAKIGNGYLSAFPESDLDAIEIKFEGAWASYYVLHKILAGFIDAFTLAHNGTAMNVARRLADYIVARLARLSPEQIEGMCRTDLKPNPTNEFGGIGESLQDMADLTGDKRYDDAARVFDRDWFIDPLKSRQDRLTGLHANTHIPMALALAKRYERTGDASLRRAVSYFWEITAVARSFANGASAGPRPDGIEKSTGGEHWPAAFTLARTLTPKNNESCVTHNMLRLTDALFRWTADPKYADFYERAYVNHVLTMQHPGYPGGYLYDHPLSPGSVKKFGHAHDAFWCCYGSTVEAYERLANGIYYIGAAGDLRVNLFIPSEFNWEDKGVALRQEISADNVQAVKFTVRCDQPTRFAMSLRVPAWSAGATVQINGEEPQAAPADAAMFERAWRDGDTVVLTLPPRLSVETMPDDAGMIAFRYGPDILAARSDTDLRLDVATASAAINQLKPALQAGHFTLTLADGRQVELVPLNEVADESFGVYHTVGKQ